MYDSQPQLSKESKLMFCIDKLAKILKTEKKSFQLNHIEVHRQTGSNDCGLFAIANAVTLCIGADRATIKIRSEAM